MAREPKSENNIQVFSGSKPKADVFTQNAGSGCCGTGLDIAYDKLAERVRFDNGLKHVNPTGGVDRYRFPGGNGFSADREAILKHINAIGVGATISVIAIPTYAFVTGVGVHIDSAEAGLTFDLVTRNGLVLPVGSTPTLVDGGEGAGSIEMVENAPIKVTATADPDAPCAVTRTMDEGSFEGFGALGGNDLFIDIFGRNAEGSFALEADEIMLRVATMPAGGVVIGNFDLTISASYDVIHRAEQ